MNELPALTNHDQAELLLELARFLDKLPDERFYYGTWVGYDWKGGADLSCGTTACAAGWATTLPSWRARGLMLARDDTIGGYVTDVTDQPAFDALSDALNLPRYVVLYLFADNEDLARGWPVSPDKDATAKEVAAHIRRFALWLDAKE